ncbi:MAG: phenylalanine--tRNA ligase subunit beta [Armatimonadetes bacterium]|nr:phenylalanine--tRNA ligase subunit beta [Armatimonadota bacterium]
MLVPVEWLREYVSFDVPPKQLAERLTLAGLEVEEVTEIGDKLVFSTYVTPNRPDLLSIVGVAREVSALLGTQLNPPIPKLVESDTKASDLVKVDIESPINCPRYSARVVTDVKVGPSPAWVQERLVAGGLRPINNVVDATNYVLLELGQPLHAFDYDLVKNHHIIVRQAIPDERIVTLDGEERILNEEILVIADSERAIAIAGVMGGADTEVSFNTRNVLLESAHFNRISIRKTAKYLGMSTEASYRFERSVDPELTTYALDRVAQLIVEWSGGSIAKGIVDAYPRKINPVTLEIRPQRTSEVLGVKVSSEQIADYLSRLGMSVAKGDPLLVTVPTFRPDITREIDLIEEVGRLYGYNAIPEKLPMGETMQGSDSPEGRFASEVADTLIACGLQEVVTHSLVPPTEGEHGEVVIRNPISDDLSRIRKRLIPNLLGVIGYNASRGIRDIGIFEIGRVASTDNGAIIERLSIAGALTGSMWQTAWNVDKSSLEADFFLAKGVVETIFNRLVKGEVLFRQARLDGFHPTRAAIIQIGNTEVGVLGEVSSDLAAKFDLPGRTYAFELDFDELISRRREAEPYRPFSRYPALTRDLAVVVADEIPYDRVREVLEEGAGDLLESISLFDLYKGPPLPAGQKSLAFRMVFRSPTKTLRDEEVDDRMARIRNLLGDKLAASFRDA